MLQVDPGLLSDGRGISLRLPLRGTLVLRGRETLHKESGSHQAKRCSKAPSSEGRTPARFGS